MKIAVAAALLGLASGARTESYFNEWKANYGKTYATAEEHAERFAVFKENAKFVDAHNAQNLPWTVSLNEFADLTNEEFMAQRMGTRPSKFGTSGSKVHQRIGGAPDAVDWRLNSTVVGPVKNQASCGSCWAFSAIASAEGQAGLKSGTYQALSEQNIVDCAKDEGVPYDPTPCCDGCQGGLMDNAFQYVVDKQGGVLEAEGAYPYTGRNGKCKFDADKGVATITGFTDCRPGSADPSPATPEEEDNVLDAVANVGPVSIAVDAGGLGWQLYFGGVHSCNSGASKPAKADHGVAIVGYGNDGDKKYWIIRNSWGGSWGEKGYMRLEYGSNACGVANYASYPNIA